MTQADQCFETVCTILRDCCGVPEAVELRPELSLQGDLALDSIGLLNLLTELEEEYDFRLDEPLETPPQTVGELVEHVMQYASEDSNG